MKLKTINKNFSVCKIKTAKNIDLKNEFTFLSVTDEEISLVCPTEDILCDTTDREDGWKCFRIEGILDFSLIGILSNISKILSENKIGIFVISTYNTDYIFVKEENYKNSLEHLEKNGYRTDL